MVQRYIDNDDTSRVSCYRSRCFGRRCPPQGRGGSFLGQRLSIRTLLVSVGSLVSSHTSNHNLIGTPATRPHHGQLEFYKYSRISFLCTDKTKSTPTSFIVDGQTLICYSHHSIRTSNTSGSTSKWKIYSERFYNHAKQSFDYASQ
jgi:hypothetical protein